MEAEWRDVFEALDKSVYHNKSGIHISNKDLQKVDDEMSDVVDQMKAFKKSAWK
jgi:hypothetical protein